MNLARDRLIRRVGIRKRGSADTGDIEPAWTIERVEVTSVPAIAAQR
jgi:hypothetical protein